MVDTRGDDVPCHDMTERECRLTQKISKLARKHDEISHIISEIQRGLTNNDWYFINHSFQIREESKTGKRQKDSYLRALEKDVEDYIWELNQIRSFLSRTDGAILIREIRLVNVDEDEDEAPIN